MSVLVWSLIGILLVLVLAFFGLWRRGVNDSINLTNFIVLILLEEKERTFQAENLKRFLEKSPAPTAEILGAQMSAGLSAIARERAVLGTMPYVISLMEEITAGKVRP